VVKEKEGMAPGGSGKTPSWSLLIRAKEKRSLNADIVAGVRRGRKEEV